ncbi:hypothetical protein F183_A54180 [Bryobacterales bacterium F-183]|nr:hypothetical protein F183_A54180 [Bryobacterales bacterium F-183]
MPASLLFLLCLSQDVPATDGRLTNIPNTDTHFSMPVYGSRQAWEKRAAQLRKQILVAAGLSPLPPKSPLNAEIFGKVERPDYTVEKVLIQTLPGYYLGGNLYRPKGKTGPFPAIASPHGHWNYGRLENTNLGSMPARGINLARQGYVVFMYDMVGYNDTVQTPHAFGGPREQLWSFGPLGLQLWNSIRVVDFLQSLPDVDRERIGATGASGGGTQTFLLAAVDNRVKFAAPVNMISGIMQGGSPCENAPSLRFDTNNIELAALIAPRPMIMVSATGDWTKNTLHEEYPSMRQIYRLYNAHESLEAVQFDFPHNYNKESREAVYKFFAKQMLKAKNWEEYKEKSFSPEMPQNLLVLHGRTLPAGALTYEQLVEQWIESARQQNQASKPEEQKERLQLAMGVREPEEKVLAKESGGQLRLSRTSEGDLVTGIVQGKPDTIVVHPDGATAAPAAAGTLRLNVFRTRDQSAKQFQTFNRADDALRVQDILTAIAYLKQQGVAKPKLKCSGKASIWCTFAAAVADTNVTLDAPVQGFRGTDQDIIEQFFVPGLQRAGGWNAALALANRAN